MIPTFVFVHGSGSSAHSWTAVQREMAARGHRTLAIDLPGRGAGFTRAYHEQDLEAFAAEPSMMSDVTADDFVRQVVEAVQRVRHHGPVFLVAHSFGGLPVTAAANAIPELIDRVVYIAAQCPVDRAPASTRRRPRGRRRRSSPRPHRSSSATRRGRDSYGSTGVAPTAHSATRYGRPSPPNSPRSSSSRSWPRASRTRCSG
ncbi:alpha/beta hydrolase [Amycolatopsis keratiniphila]|uniref:alpha/beta hydrolase n=1 Tax=Amycolatopsis keratiniphila TaxID=129921 RepID=UPI00373FD7AB